MKITKEQEKYLNSFTCERLSSDDTNKALIDNFVSSKGESLVGYLKNCRRSCILSNKKP